MRATGPRDRKKAHGLGIRAERVAVGLLRLKGYRILARRYQVREGEIDIVARRGDTVAFVEVKVRPSLERLGPRSARLSGGGSLGPQEAGSLQILGRRL
jgi:Uncharacterised protein family UPF0102